MIQPFFTFLLSGYLNNQGIENLILKNLHFSKDSRLTSNLVSITKLKFKFYVKLLSFHSKTESLKILQFFQALGQQL